MIKPDSWLPLYVADYLADTTRLTTEQHGAYLLLIMDYWRNGPPPDDDNVLAQITGLHLRRWKTHRSAIQTFFTILDGKWRQKRLDKEVGKAKSVVAQRSQAGKASANKRWGNRGHNENGNEGINDYEADEQRKNAPSQLTGIADAKASAPKEVNSDLKNQPLIPGSLCLTEGTTRARVAKPEPVTAETWLAYSEAYRARYGVDPVRNARVNAQLAQLVQRLGAVGAPLVAAFYLRHNRALYVSAKHATNLLLRDAEGLHTELFSGRMVTDTAARQLDKKQNNLSVAEQLIAEGKHGQ